jgi:hypothetical protein
MQPKKYPRLGLEGSPGAPDTGDISKRLTFSQAAEAAAGASGGLIDLGGNFTLQRRTATYYDGCAAPAAGCACAVRRGGAGRMRRRSLRRRAPHRCRRALNPPQTTPPHQNRAYGEGYEMEEEEAPPPPAAAPPPQIKILVRGTDEALSSVRVELSSDNNVFFHFAHAVDAPAFNELRVEQRLMVELNQYPKILVKLLNQAREGTQLFGPSSTPFWVLIGRGERECAAPSACTTTPRPLLPPLCAAGRAGASLPASPPLAPAAAGVLLAAGVCGGAGGGGRRRRAPRLCTSPRFQGG